MNTNQTITCDLGGCRVPAIGYGRCVQHVAPMMTDLERENAPAVAGPGRSETPTNPDDVYERR